jgi:AcrR family transcriptional regulator
MQRRSELTRSQIMDAAISLFSEGGYEATSVAEICAVANASKGAFYHHFPAKQDLFLQILNDWLDGVDERLFTRRQGDETVPDALLRMAKAIGFVFQTASGQLPMFLEFMVQASRDEAVWAAAVAPYRRYQDQFALLIREGQAEGSVRPDVDAQVTAQSIISLAIGVLLQSVMDPESADWEKVINYGIAAVVADIKRSA